MEILGVYSLAERFKSPYFFKGVTSRLIHSRRWHPPTWRLTRVHLWYPWKLYPSDCSSVDSKSAWRADKQLRMWWCKGVASALVRNEESMSSETTPSIKNSMMWCIHTKPGSADSYISHISQQKEQGNLTFDTVSDSSTNASSWCVFAFVFALETQLHQ